MSWTCQRVQGGVKCKHLNPNRKRKCEQCGKTRPPRRRPAHLSALGESYEAYVARTGGEFCALCKRGPGTRKLNRDHDHRGSGKPRALLCGRCNRALPSWITPAWLRAAAEYLERFEEAS